MRQILGMRYFIEISYLGTAYHGWQLQPNAITIQEKLEDALSKILKQDVRIHGSSRTDTGVHARQQFAHFDIESLSIQKDHLIWKLNSLLPADISVNNIYKVSQDCHSRFDAENRKYIYRIHLKKDPFVIENSLYFRNGLDIEKLNNAALILFEYEDFQCFSKVKTEVNNFVCQISEAQWLLKGHHLEFHIKANRFLRGMVRAIVGTLLDIGMNKMNLDDLRSVIQSKDRTKAGSAAKAVGLTLEEVNYPVKYFING